MASTTPADIDSYIEQAPDEAKEHLMQMRAIIKKVVPSATEAISYSIPAFNYKGRNLVYFAGYKKHVSLYPAPSADKGFEKDYAKYNTSGKGTIQFPLDKPLPVGLITKIVKYRMKEDEAKAGSSLKKKTAGN